MAERCRLDAMGWRNGAMGNARRRIGINVRHAGTSGMMAGVAASVYRPFARRFYQRRPLPLDAAAGRVRWLAGAVALCHRAGYEEGPETT